MSRIPPHKAYTGPDPASLEPQRTPAQAERHFARAAAATARADGLRPGRVSKLLGVGGWVLGGVATVYMALYADFGPGEHVFSPLRRAFARYTHDTLTLSPSERSMLGLDAPPRSAAAPAQPGQAQRPT